VDIAALSTSNIPTAISVGTAVLDMNLDTIKQAGADLIKMMEQSVNPNIGQNINVYL
jgi:hypothetical protein